VFFVFIFLFITVLTVSLSLSSIDTLDFRPVSKSKRKRGSLQLPDGTGPSFASPNQYAVLPDSESDAEDIGFSSQPSSRKSKISPIVIYSYLNNHSAALKEVTETISTPVDGKSSHTGFYSI